MAAQTPQKHRTLRLISLLTIIPALPLGVSHAIVSGSPLPGVGLVPMAFSAVLAIVTLCMGNRKQRISLDEPTPQVGKIIITVADILLALAYLVILIFSWIILGSYGAGEVELGTYATGK